MSWTISYLAATFRGGIGSHLDSLEKRPPPDDAEVQRRYNEIQAFVTELKKVATVDDPTTLMKPGYEDNGTAIDGYFVLEVGSWRGFYRVDHLAKTAVGTLAINSDDQPMASLKKALDDAEKAGK